MVKRGASGEPTAKRPIEKRGGGLKRRANRRRKCERGASEEESHY